MSKIINERGMMEMLYGACFMGAGGGGSLSNGLAMLESCKAKNKTELQMLDVEEMEDNSYAGIVAGMGAPSAIKERLHDFALEPLGAYDGLVKLGFVMNRDIKYVMAVEYGGLNTFVPMLVALEKGIPFIDADGCGRAVPALETLLLSVNGVATSPLVCMNRNKDVIIGYTENPCDAKALENIGRSFCVASGMLAGIAGWMIKKDEIKEKVFPGAYSYAQKIGRAILKSKEEMLDVSKEIAAVTEYRELFKGKLIKFETEQKGGFDFGRTYFNGCEEYVGKKFRVDFQNENLIAYEDDKPIITVPELICMIDLETYTPLTNTDLQEGMTILIAALPAHENWWKTPRGFDCWKPFLDVVGYSGDSIPY